MKRLLLFFCLIAGLSGCFSDQDLLTLEERAWLTSHKDSVYLAQPPKWPPLSYIDERGRYVGLTEDLTRMIEKKIGFKFQRVYPSDWEHLMTASLNQEIDVIVGMVSSTARRDYLNFTSPFLNIPTAALVKKDLNIASGVENLAGYKVGITGSYFLEDYLKRLVPDIDLVRYSDNTEGVISLSRGEIDVFCVSLISASHLMEELKIDNLKVAFHIGFDYDLAIAVRKDWPILHRIISKTLKKIPADYIQSLYREKVGFSAGKFSFSVKGKNVGLFISVFIVAACIAVLLFYYTINKRVLKPMWVVIGVSLVVVCLVLFFAYKKKSHVRLNEEDLSWIESINRPIRVSADPDYPPIDFVNEAGSYQGVSSEYLKIIESFFGKRFSFKRSDSFSDALQHLKDKEVDMVLTMQKNEARKEYAIFSEPLITVENIIVVKKGTQDKELQIEDLREMKVGVVESHSVGAWIKRDYPEISLTSVKSAEEGLVAVSFGNLDAMLVEMPLATYLIDKKGIANLRIGGKMPYKYDLRIGIRKDWPELKILVNKCLQSISPSVHHEIFNKWISLSAKEDATYKKYLIYALGLFGTCLVIIVVISVWSRSLKKSLEIQENELRTEYNERIEVQQRLMDSERLFHAIFDQAFSLIGILSPDGDVVAVNQTALLFKNVEMSAVVGKKVWLTPWFEDDHEASLKIKKAVTNAKDGYVVRDVMKQINNDFVHYIDLTTKPIMDENNKLVHLVIEGRDITETKFAEKSLLIEKEKYMSLIENVLVGIMVFKSDLNVTLINAKAASILGLDASKIRGAKLSDFGWKMYKSEKEELPLSGNPAIKAFTSAMPVSTCKLLLRNDDGNQIWVLINAFPFFDDRNNVDEVVVSFADISNLQAAQDDLLKYQQNLESLVKERTSELEKAKEKVIQSERLAALGQLIATVAHEIRNPLGTVRTSVYNIENGIDGNRIEFVRKALNLAKKNVDRCSDIITELMDYTRSRELELTVVDLSDWLHEVLSNIEIPPGLSFSEELQDGLKVRLDVSMMNRAILNLVFNAIQSISDDSEEKKVSLKAYSENDKLCIVIKDTGIGMTEQVASRAFELLYSTKTFGVGLGLPVVKNVVEKHGGTISIQSAVKKGTVFTLVFPSSIIV